MSQALKAAMGAQRELTPYEKFRNKLFAVKPELAPLVGPGNVERFVRTALNAVQANPKLLEANGRSLLNSCMKAAQDGLLPDGREAVFNIYRTKVKTDEGDRWVDTVQYLPMVGGLIKKLYASGGVTFVDGVAVYEKDIFDYQRGDDPKIDHKPYGGSEEPGPIVAAYAIIKLTNGETKREVMWKRDLDKVRKAAKTDKGWSEWEDQFSIKSVLKRVYKQLPSAIEIDSVVANDNVAMGFTAETSELELLPETAGGTAPPEMPITTGDKVDVATGEIQSVAAQQASNEPDEEEIPVADKFSTRLMTCKDLDTIDVIADEMRTTAGISETDLATLSTLAANRKAQLSGAGAKKGGK
jgi:recombination protein RecT